MVLYLGLRIVLTLYYGYTLKIKYREVESLNGPKNKYTQASQLGNKKYFQVHQVLKECHLVQHHFIIKFMRSRGNLTLVSIN